MESTQTAPRLPSEHTSPIPIDILLVEDDPLDAELALMALKGSAKAHSIFLAKDGSEAIEYLLGTDDIGSGKVRVAPKVILLDLKLPRVSGLEVLQRMKLHPQLKVIPIVIMTSSAENADLKRLCYDLGVNSFLLKPTDASRFGELYVETCAYWLQHNQAPELSDDLE